MPLPNYHLHSVNIGQCLNNWAENRGESLGALLSIGSGANDPGEPPWLALCEWLAAPTALGIHALASDDDHMRLERLRAALWGSEALEANELINDLFPQGKYLPRVPTETALRAIAVAECAREAMAKPSGRRKPWNNPIELHPLERLLVQRHWGHLNGRLTESDASLLHVLLVDDRAAKDERGRLCRLRLWKVDLGQVPGDAAWHGAVVRAPAALLLTLKQSGDAPNDAFERALHKVQTVLQASLAQPSPSGDGAWAMAWSLQPVAMIHELAGGQTITQPWGLDAVSGGSATLPFALGALHLFRNELRTDPADLFLPLREQLRAIDPRALAMSAAFVGDAPPEGVSPLDWPLEPIRDLGDKLSAFVQADRLQPKCDTRTRLALVADGQAGAFAALPRERPRPCATRFRRPPNTRKRPCPKRCRRCWTTCWAKQRGCSTPIRQTPRSARP